MVCNSVLIFYELFLYVSRFSNCLWTPSSSWMLYLHCHVSTVRVLCSCPSPSVCGLKDGRGQIISTTSLTNENNARCEETQELTPRAQPQLCTESRLLEYMAVHGSPLAHMSCQITIMGREKAVPGGLEYMGPWSTSARTTALPQMDSPAAASERSHRPRMRPSSSELTSTTALGQRNWACLQRSGKSLLWPAAPMEWVLKGSLRTSMVCTAQQEGSCPEICFGLWGRQWKSVLLLILKKHLPVGFAATLTVYPSKNTSINALDFLGGYKGGRHAGALWLLA